jgi:hypothetical protein
MKFRSGCTRLEGTDYLNWDNGDDRRLILRGPAAVAQRLGLERLRTPLPIGVLDELHNPKSEQAELSSFPRTGGSPKSRM